MSKLYLNGNLEVSNMKRKLNWHKTSPHFREYNGQPPTVILWCLFPRLGNLFYYKISVKFCQEKSHLCQACGISYVIKQGSAEGRFIWAL